MINRGVAQSGSASALGAEGRRFESCHPDHLRSHRLEVRMPAFHAGDRGSIPLGTTFRKGFWRNW